MSGDMFSDWYKLVMRHTASFVYHITVYLRTRAATYNLSYEIRIGQKIYI